MQRAIVALALLLTAGPAAATVFWVYPGQSIGAAVDGSADGDSIVIADGTYTESVVLNGRVLTIGSGYLLDADTSHIAATVIQADLNRIDTTSCFVYTQIQETGARLVGLTLTGGAGTRWRTQWQDYGMAGGAVYVNQAAVSVESCRIITCSAGSGGALFAAGRDDDRRATLALRECSLSACTAGQWGGGVYARHTLLTVDHCTLVDNAAGYSGGGVMVMNSHAEIRDSQIRQCQSDLAGGMDYLGCSGVISGCVFEDNFGGEYDGAHLVAADPDAVITGCVFRGTTSYGRAIVLSGGVAPLRFTGNVIEGHDAASSSAGTLLVANSAFGDIAYCIFRNNINGQGGTIRAIPDAEVRIHHNVFTGNTSGEPAQGSALISLLAPVSLDSNIIEDHSGASISFAGEAYAVTLHAEHNWWGHASGPYHPTLNPAGQGDSLFADSILFIPWLTTPPDTSPPPSAAPPRPEVESTWHLLACYPNPFNSAIQIRLAGFTGPDFRLSLHNVLGQEVTVLHEGPVRGGTVAFTAPAELASGVYFLSLRDRTTRLMHKVMLLR